LRKVNKILLTPES